MANYTTQDIRNVALIGHAGAGKTLLAEALLHHAGAIRTRGELARGTTVCDFDAQEKELGHSVNATTCYIDYQEKHINLIDTPGYPDLMGRSIAMLAAVETSALLINAQSGIEIGTKRMMDAAIGQKLCRMIIINKIDVPDTNLPAVLANVQEIFGRKCLPVNLPAENGSKVLDCFFIRKGDATDFSSIEAAHKEIIEQVVEEDDALMELYLEEDKEPTTEQLHDPFEKALREGHLIPVCFVSAETGAGIPELLEIITRLAPNPLEANPPPYIKGEGKDAQPVEIDPDPEKHVLAHVFKIAIDPYVGRMGLFRIHQGTVRTGSQLFIGDARKPFKVAHLLKIQGKETTEIPQAIPGDICAVAKIDDIHFDAVLHDSHDEDHYHMQAGHQTPPMMGLAITPKKRGDEQKLSETLHKLEAEDPSIRIEHNAIANETVLYGIGDLHLRVLLEKMSAQFGLVVDSHPPSIAYRETITRKAEGHHRHKKQTGGAGQFGEVYLRVEPLERGAGFEFNNKVVGGSIPSQFILAVEKGVRQVLETGAIAGYPLQDIKVTVYDGKHHSVDSKEVAFVAAGKKAFIEAVEKANPIVMEPFVNLHVAAPSNAVGGITGEISGLRGRLSNQTMLRAEQVMIEGQAPLAELQNFSARVKSHTAGAGTFTMEFSHYEPVPPSIQHDLTKSFTGHGSDD
ncbi:MAG: elongation factor G [Gammaproteobacteria bacterium]